MVLSKILLLELAEITVVKGENKKILDSLSLEINAGENVAILGPNGAGKSSLMKVITREYYPLAGQKNCKFKIWGQERWNIFDLRFLLGIVSPTLEYAFAKPITGFEMVLSGFFSSIGLYREKVTSGMKKKVKETLEFLEITHLQERMMNEMSSGEAQRFLIARALVHNPKALILDEPSTNLDIHSFYKFTDVLRKIAKSGVSIILVTQNLRDIIPEIKRVLLMKKGRIVNDGPKEKILTQKTISELFEIPLEIKEKKGYYYALRA